MTRIALTSALLLAVLLIAAVPRCFAFGIEFRDSWPFHSCKSISCSKKHKTFVKVVEPIPSSFTWEGHRVEFKECWASQSGSVCWLNFTLQMDGQALQEFLIQKRDGTSIVFRHPADDGTKSRYRITTEFSGRQYIRPNIQFIHSIGSFDPEIKMFELGVGTESENSHHRTMSETVLTFPVSGYKKVEGLLIDPTAIVFASKRIPAGTYFSYDKLLFRDVEKTKISPDAVFGTKALLGRRAGEDIPKNQQILRKSVLGNDLTVWTEGDAKFEKRLEEIEPKLGCGVVLYPMRDLSVGETIGACTMVDGECPTSEISTDACRSYKQLFGRTLRNAVLRGQTIRESDLLQN